MNKQERDGSIISQLRQRIRELKNMLLLSESQNYCKICGNTLDGYMPPKGKNEN